MISHPTQIPQLIDEAFDQSAIGLAVSGDLEAARRTAIENPVDTALTLSGAGSILGRGITGLGRIGALGKAARVEASDLTRPALASRQNVRVRSDYSPNYFRRRRERRADQRLSDTGEENIRLLQEQERRATAGEEPLPGKPKRVGNYIPVYRVVVDPARLPGVGRFVPGARRPRKGERLPPVIQTERGSRAYTEMVERRNAIEGLSRTELKQRASGNMGQERFEAVVRKHGLPEPEADLMAWTLLGRMVPDAKESIANLQRELDGWAAAARTHEIRSNPKLREVNAEGIVSGSRI